MRPSHPEARDHPFGAHMPRKVCGCLSGLSGAYPHHLVLEVWNDKLLQRHDHPLAGLAPNTILIAAHGDSL